ncbi:hypothetical protein VPHK460_0146 [Vibrio phage K460]
MNNKQLFKQAHEIARNTVAEVGNYQIAFTLALGELRSVPTVAKKVKAFVYNIPSALMITVWILLLAGLGGGFGGLMAYHGLINSIPVMYILGSGLIAAMVVCVYTILKSELEEFKYNYLLSLKM